MPAYLHWIVYLPIAVFCASAIAAAVTNAIVESRARRAAPWRAAPRRAAPRRAAPAPQPSAKIYYFIPAKTPLRSNPGAMRPELRLVSNGG